ncbi:MAG: CHAD domain-containing protein [Acidobacteriaceae bacterium]
MAPADQSAHPVLQLRQAVAALEASALLCLTKPGKIAVHRLRTSTRRVQAQLELLSMLPGLPPHQLQARKAARLLKQLRHDAGRVRDIDVQRDLLRGEVAANKVEGAPSPDRELRGEVRRLRRALKRNAEEAADRLQRLLHKQRPTLSHVFQELLDALAPAQSIALNEDELIALARDCYRNRCVPSLPDAVPQDTAELHEIRKRAKLARYLAESAPLSYLEAHRLAARYEALQQAGGEWHDWLILAEIAAVELGDSAILPRRFAAHAEYTLQEFQRRLRHKI